MCSQVREWWLFLISFSLGKGTIILNKYTHIDYFFQFTFSSFFFANTPSNFTYNILNLANPPKLISNIFLKIRKNVYKHLQKLITF